MEPVGDLKASIIPFEVSVAKRTSQQTVEYANLDVHPMMQVIHPDKSFDPKAVLEDKSLEQGQIHAKMPVAAQNRARIVPISPKMMPKIGLKVLPNRKVCFAGELLTGIFMPRNPSLQGMILTHLFILYRPCIEIHGDQFRLDRECFTRRQAMFLRVYYLTLQQM